MNKTIIFRSMGHSDTIANYIHTQFERISKFFKREPLPINLAISLQAHHEKFVYTIQCKVNSLHYHIKVNLQGNDIYAIIDEAVHKINKEIVRKKEKFMNISHHKYNFSV